MSTDQRGGLSLSTVWASRDERFQKEPPSAEAFLDRVGRCGLARLELEYRLPGPLINSIIPLLPAHGLSVSSIHNFCPFPEEVKGVSPSGDLFNLADLDKDERRRAVDYTVRTLELASDLEAGAVVLHLGGVTAARDKQVVKDAAAKGEMTPELAANLELRAQIATPHLDAVSFSLERLIKRAEPLGVVLGLENRFHAFQIPDQPEMALLLDRFSGGPVGYWHDLGHAVVREHAGMDSAASWLELFGDKLAGCHLHDVRDEKDHLLPGDGNLDWRETAEALVHSPIKVVEIDAGPTADEVRAAGDMLGGLFNEVNTEQKQEAVR